MNEDIYTEFDELDTENADNDTSSNEKPTVSNDDISQNDYEIFLQDIEKYNDNLNSKDNQNNSNTSQEEGNFDKPFENISTNINPQKESPEKAELKEGVSKIVTGSVVIDIVDSIFPKTLTFLLGFFDDDFRKIDVEKIKLDDSEKEIYKPVGDYLAKILVNNVNPLLFFGILYTYRTSLAIYIEYQSIKNKSNNPKKPKNMPLKKQNYENVNPNNEFRKNDDINRFKIERDPEIRRLKQEIQELHQNIRDMQRYYDNIRITDPSESRELKQEIERLNDTIKQLENEIAKQKRQNENNVITENISKPQITTEKENSENENKKTKRKYNIDPDVLRKKLEKMREARQNKQLKQEKNLSDNVNTSNSDTSNESNTLFDTDKTSD